MSAEGIDPRYRLKMNRGSSVSEVPLLLVDTHQPLFIDQEHENQRTSTAAALRDTVHCSNGRTATKSSQAAAVYRPSASAPLPSWQLSTPATCTTSPPSSSGMKMDIDDDEEEDDDGDLSAQREDADLLFCFTGSRLPPPGWRIWPRWGAISRPEVIRRGLRCIPTRPE